jgi:hypothetical protein
VGERYLSPEQSAEKRQSRVRRTASAFQEARELAESYGFVLRQCSRIHYQLSPKDRRWILNIYPSNRRLYHDKKKPGPFIRVRSDWSLIDVVRAAAKANDTKEIRNGPSHDRR